MPRRDLRGWNGCWQVRCTWVPGRHPQAIGLGLALALIDSRFSAPKLAILRDMRMATIGIALLILLPVVRAIMMLIVYLQHRDYLFSVFALLVLTIILLGFALGLEGRHSASHDAAMLRKSNSFLTAMPHIPSTAKSFFHT
jgi:Protein of unknown function (DUF1634)